MTITGGRLQVYVHDGGPAGNAAALVGGGRIDQDDRWHHFAFCRDENGIVQLYVDGQPAGSVQAPRSVGAITTNLRSLGRRAMGPNENPAGPSATFDGWLDEVAVFDHVLTLAEIQRLSRLP